MRALLLALILFSTAPVIYAETTPTRLALGKQLVELLNFGSMFNAYLKQCQSPEGTSFDGKAAFTSNPGSFGGVSPQSTYWPEVEAIYGRFRTQACSYISEEKFADNYARSFAEITSEEDLRTAVAFYSSPSGKRLQEAAVTANELFQKYATELTTQAYAKANEQYQSDIRSLIRKYKKEPR